jgi:hypothetical protein
MNQVSNVNQPKAIDVSTGMVVEAGIEEFDVLKYGEVFAFLKSFVIYKQPVQTTPKTTSTMTFSLASKALLAVERDMHRVSNLVLLFTGLPCSVEQAFKTIKQAFDVSKCKVLICAGRTMDGDVLMFVKKVCYRALPDLSIEGFAPRLYSLKNVKNDSVKSVETSLTNLYNCMIETVSNMRIQYSYGTFSFEQLLHNAKEMSPEQLIVLKGKCEAVPVKQRNEFQQTFLRVFLSLNRVMELSRNGGKSMCYSAWDPSIQIIPLNELKNLATVFGTRSKGTDKGFESYSLLNLLQDPSLMSKCGILILGANQHSGCGKSQFAKRLGLECAKAVCAALDLPKDRAVVVITNTIDAARDIVFLPGMVWLLDEFEAGDRDQVIYCSANMMKVLFTRSEPCSVRGRCADIKVPANVAVIITGNADSVQEWSGARFAWTEPLQRKCIHFQLSRDICQENWHTRTPDVSVGLGLGTEVLAKATALLKQEMYDVMQDVWVEGKPKSSFIKRFKFW